MSFIVGIICLFATWGLSKSKGFNPWCWVFLSGPLALIILACMPSAEAVEIESDIRLKRKNTGNSVGLTLTSIMLILGIIALGIVMSSGY